MFTTIGVILILIALVMLGAKWFAPTDTQNQPLKGLPKIITGWNWKKSVTLVIIGLVLFAVPYSYIYAKQGHQYYIVNPLGGVKCIYNAGVKFVIPGSRIQEWEKFIDIKTVKKGEAVEGIEGVITDFTNFTAKDLETGKAIKHTLWGIPARFNDQVRGNVKVSVRIQLPQNDEDFIRLVEDFRHPKNLVNNTLIPTVREQTINVGYMFSAEDYVSGEASNFRQTLDESLKYGGYAVDREEKPDTVFGEIQVEGDRKIKEIRQIIEVTIREDANKIPIRTEHDITKNKLIVSQVIVDQVNLEPKFQQKLEKQRDISAQKSIEIQLTETAQMEQQRIIAQGERDKAAKKVEKELEQVGVLTKIETRLKEERTNKELAEIQLQTANINAKKMKVDADAKRYEITHADGLSEEVKFIEQQKTKRTLAVATAIEKANWPKSFVGGSSGGNGDGSLLSTLIGAKLATKMVVDK